MFIEMRQDGRRYRGIPITIVEKLKQQELRPTSDLDAFMKAMADRVAFEHKKIIPFSGETIEVRCTAFVEGLLAADLAVRID